MDNIQCEPRHTRDEQVNHGAFGRGKPARLGLLREV